MFPVLITAGIGLFLVAGTVLFVAAIGYAVEKCQGRMD